jgi:Na(+)-translocating NADH:ubiquinone oxidoreductase F subunit
LCTYPIETRDGRLWFHPGRPAGAGARPPRALRLRVVDCRSVSTFIRELTFDRVGAHGDAAFEPGDYLQFDIPEYGQIPFAGFDIPEPYATVWRARHVFGLVARHPGGARRNNYSFACDPVGEPRLRFNVRLATPPPGQDCPPGVGSPYMFSLRPGDEVDAFGPYGGDFRIRPTQCEMVYIGGGAGMAPIRSHLDGLFGRERTSRRVSFWYGARSRQEIYYDDVFSELAARHRNFSFHVALSSPLDEDRWTGERGMIHEVVCARHLAAHPAPAAAEYYVCGPPPMVRACLSMLAEAGVPDDRIARDEF